MTKIAIYKNFGKQLYILNRDAQSFKRFDNGHFLQFLCLFRAPDKLLAHIGLMKQVHMAFTCN